MPVRMLPAVQEAAWPSRLGPPPSKPFRCGQRRALVRAMIREPKKRERPFANPLRVPPEPRRSEIIEGLLALRRAGFYSGIWIDADMIRVRFWPWGEPEYLPWRDAEKVLEGVL